jgi:hypothetical protein
MKKLVLPHSLGRYLRAVAIGKDEEIVHTSGRLGLRMS